MKINTYIFLALLTNFFVTQSQNQEIISIKYKPTTVYFSEVSIAYEYSFKRKFNKKTKQIQDSMGANLKRHDWGKKIETFDVVTTTSKVDSLNNLPTIFDYQNFTYFGETSKKKKYNKHNFKSLKLVGKFNPDNNFSIQNIYADGKEISNVIQLQSEEVYGNILPYFSSFNPSEKKIKITNRYLDLEELLIFYEKVFKYPILKVSFTFTLEKIKNNIAYFSVKEELESKVVEEINKLEEIEIQLKSKGLLKINLNENFIEFFSLNSTLIIKESFLGTKKKSTYKTSNKIISKITTQNKI